MGATTNEDVDNKLAEDKQKLADEEKQMEHIPYPKSVFFIVSNEFCERFSYYGMRTILSLYLTDKLFFSKSDATVIYHTFTMFVYFFPVFGAMLADSLLGKFNTILYVSMIYAVGNIVLSLAATPPLHLPSVGFSMLGLLLVALGTGGIKPCVSAFGGDQFVMPQQELQLAKFFSMFYFSINAGSLISTAITPILRQDVHCFGEQSCFSVAFGVPGILMIVSIVVFALGKPLYKIKKPAGNMVVKVSKCIGNAISVRGKEKKVSKKEHWLDYAEAKYGKKLVDDLKATLKVLFLYLPLPVFWALFDQQGTGWTFQARRMNGNIGFYTILPDQMQVVNPLLILIFIPLFQYIIYPILNKFNLLTKPLHRIVCGGLLAAIAFIVSAGISMAIEAENPVLPTSSNGQLRIYNNLGCKAKFKIEEIGEMSLDPMSFYEKVDIPLSASKVLGVDIDASCYPGAKSQSINLTPEVAVGYYFSEDGFAKFVDDIDKSENAYPKFRLLANQKVAVKVYDESGVNQKTLSDPKLVDDLVPGTYTLKTDAGKESNMLIELGGVYAILYDGAAEKFVEATVTKPNGVHMLLLLPQYIIITMAEIMFSITGLEFSYSQAPKSMKSVMQACWLLTTAVGNLIVVIIESARIFEQPSSDFFLYAGLMVLDMLLFAWMARGYVYVTVGDDSEDAGYDMDNKEITDSKGVQNNGYTKSVDDA